MKFNPITKEVYTDQGVLVKKLYCPLKMQWDRLLPEVRGERRCEACERSVIDTSELTDEDLLKIVERNPAQCLKIDLQQENLKLTLNEAHKAK